MRKTNEEDTLVPRENDLIRNETAELLHKPQGNSNRVQKDDGYALATVVGVGLIRPGALLTDIGGSCGIFGIFGSCKTNQNQTQKTSSECINKPWH